MHGNLLNDKANTFTYDTPNGLISVTDSSGTCTYGYDGLNIRYEQTAAGVTTTIPAL